jgi:hypothetical protein
MALEPQHGDGKLNLLYKIAQNTYASAELASSAIQSSGNGYVLCQQGDDLAAKYAEAKAKNPSATNRITLFVVPSTYPLSSELAIDAEYVDLVGLGAQFQSPAVIVSNNTLNVTANDVRVSGISAGTQAFKIGNNKPLQVFENCKGGDLSFGNDGISSGKFIGCVGAGSSFGGIGTASGTFKDCIAGGESYGGGGTASGIFKNCVGGSISFGGEGVASGKFENCVGSGNSLGVDGTITGELLYCRVVGAGATYPTPSGSGIIRFCLDGDNNIVNADAP